MIVEVFTDRFMFSSPVRSDPDHICTGIIRIKPLVLLTACSNDFAQRIETQSNFGSQEFIHVLLDPAERGAYGCFPPLMAAFALGMQRRHAYDDDDDDGSMDW